MADTDLVQTRAVQLKRAGFHRRGAGWVRGSLVVLDSTLAAISTEEWCLAIRRWRRYRR
jgi:hypothetical protein